MKVETKKVNMVRVLQIMKSWSFGESHGHKSRKSRMQTISTCRGVCDKVCDESATNRLCRSNGIQ